MHQKLSPKVTQSRARGNRVIRSNAPSEGQPWLGSTLVTGLQNQIRVQFAALGHPVIGDRKYSPEEATERRIARVALHAAKLQFLHPRTKEVVTVECPLPPDFQSLLKALIPRAATSH